jgi:hypothetical protein
MGHAQRGPLRRFVGPAAAFLRADHPATGVEFRTPLRALLVQSVKNQRRTKAQYAHDCSGEEMDESDVKREWNRITPEEGTEEAYPEPDA